MAHLHCSLDFSFQDLVTFPYILEILGEEKYINISTQQFQFHFFRRNGPNHRSNIQPPSGAEVIRILLTHSRFMNQAYWTKKNVTSGTRDRQAWLRVIGTGLAQGTRILCSTPVGEESCWMWALSATAPLHSRTVAITMVFLYDKWFLRKGLGLMRCHHKVTKPQKISEIQNDR